MPSSSRIIIPSPLTQSSFSSFGTVVESPLPLAIHSIPSQPPVSHVHVVPANQNTALKFIDVTIMQNKYSQAPSKTPSKAVMNMFSCFPRPLSTSPPSSSRLFNVGILERHPYTTQTFIPMNLSPADGSTKYLVIVAPTIPLKEGLVGLGPPDWSNIRAFIAHGAQAITYGAGTWHAPMVVVGERRVDFVVVQFANEVQTEDCQEVESEGESVSMIVDLGDATRNGRAKL